MAVTLFSIFLTSCEKDPIKTEATELDELNILISKTNENVDLEELISTATAEELTKYQNDFIAFEYISELGLLEEVLEGTAEDFSFDSAIEKLSVAQQNELKSKFKSPFSRGCYRIGAGVCAYVPTKTCKKKKWGFTVSYPCSWKKICAGVSTPIRICID